MHKLDVFQSLWAMEQRIANQPEPRDEDNLRKIAEAGFRGIGLDAGTPEDEGYAELEVYCSLCDHFDLDVQINAFAQSDADMREALAQGLRFQGRCRAINVIAKLPYWDLDETARTLSRWHALGADFGIPVYIETHRYACTNDLVVTLQLMERAPELRMTADLSHALINQEWVFLPLTEQQQALISRVLARSDSFQGRVANAEQIQVQLEFAQHQPWIDIFQSWWQEGFQRWQQRHAANPEARCVFLCELGPPPYAMTGSDGRELSDRWEEALTLKSWAESLWLKAADA